MKSNKQSTSFLNMGTSSLLVIFLVLSLAIFATLTLSTAKSDLDFSNEMAEQKLEYYQACSNCNLALACLDNICQKQYRQSTNAQEYFDKTLQSLDNEIKGLATKTQVDDCTMTLSIQLPFSQTKKLCVLVDVSYPLNSSTNSYYEIKAWQTQTYK